MTNQTEFPPIEYDGEYPEDENFDQIMTYAPNSAAAARWLREELPRAAEIMTCCSCETTINGKLDYATVIEFRTGGWSGGEAIMRLVQRRMDMEAYLDCWCRGGYFRFVIPKTAFIGCENLKPELTERA